MRAVFVLSLSLILWQGCGRSDLDQALAPNLPPPGGGAGIMGGSGRTGAAGTRGAAGTTGIAGTTGAAGGSPFPTACVPGRSEPCACFDDAPGAQECEDDGTFGACDCRSTAFHRLQKGMIGSWVGVQRTPWVDPFQVRVVFGADGLYSSHCAQASCPAPVFYWGIDGDSNRKNYELLDVLRADPVVGFGKLTVIFGPDGDPVWGHTQTGDIEALTLSPDGKQLRFEYWNTWSGRYGPVTFDLTRTM